ncbi:unnamed protein product [Prunus brigantina]
MEFGYMEAVIEFFGRFFKDDGWLQGDISAYVMSWQSVYKVYAACILTKYKHWVVLIIDLIKYEIKVYDSMVSLIPDEILREELTMLSTLLLNVLNAIEFYEFGFYANDCNQNWWCSWPTEHVDVPQQSIV